MRDESTPGMVGTPAGRSRTLADLPPGQRCRIRGLRGGGVVRRRLLEMGLVPGATVEVLRRAPLSDPIEIRVEMSLVALRRAEARRIDVEAEDGKERE